MHNMQKVEELVRELHDASAAYYNSGTSLMSDADYDTKVKQLRELDPNHTFFREVGAPLAEHLSKAKHKIPMGSLNNCSRDGDKANPSFKEWHKKIGNLEVCLMHKLDGSSIELIYEDGGLKQALTRGDGDTGEVVTQNAIKFKSVPARVGGFTGSVRGEALLLLEDFRQHFIEHANPRNAANGTVRRSDGTGSKYLSFIAYDVITEDQEFFNHSEKLEFLKESGFNSVWYRTLKHSDDVLEFHEHIAGVRQDLPYEIDGLVVITEDIAKFNELGWRDNRPKGGIAFKFQALEATTELLGIKLSVGHTGAIYPTADLAPVEIGGVTVSSALLNNYEEIERLGVAIHDQVKVIRAGDVIPKIIGVAFPSPDRQPIFPPGKCPSCESDLVKDGAHLFCRNDECEGKALRLIKTWITKRNIMYLGDELLVELYEKHGVKEPQDLYKLTEWYLAGIKRGAGVVGSNSKRIMSELEKSKNCTLSDFVGSIGIKFLGRRQAEIMIKQGINSLEAFLTTTTNSLQNLEGFSNTKADAVVQGIKKARQRIEALLEAGVKIVQDEEVVVQEGGAMSGKAVCFTGVRPKPEEQAKFVSLGGIVKDSVSKNTTHLIVKDVSTNSSKAKKANEMGVQVISYEEFQNWLGE